MPFNLKDLLLDAVTHDLKITDFDLSLVEGIDRVVQDLKVRLWFFFKEWFLDISKGIPFYEVVNVKNPDLNAIEALFKEAIIETADVVDLLSFDLDFDSAARRMEIKFEVNTTFGPTELLTLEL